MSATKHLICILQNITEYFLIHSSTVRRILAPGEEEHLELEEEDAAAGPGSTEAFPPRAPGTVPPNKTHPLFEGSLTCCVVLFLRVVCLTVCLFDSLCRGCAWLHRSFLPASFAASQGTPFYRQHVNVFSPA